MNARSTQPFGRRGRTPNAPQAAPLTRAIATGAAQSVALSPELIAQLVQPSGKEAMARRGAHAVKWSYRAAILSGFIVAILNAAANASLAAKAKESLEIKGLGSISFGSGDSAIVVALLLAALWSGARTSALCLIVVHRSLAFFNRTSYWTYILGGGIVAVVYGLVMQAVGHDGGAGKFGLEALSGMSAGLFYRLFAGTEHGDA